VTAPVDGAPDAVELLAAAFVAIADLSAAEKAAAAAELVYRLTADAVRDGVPALEHVLIRDSLAGAMASLGYAQAAHALASMPMPADDAAPPRCIAPAAPSVRRGDDVLANDAQGRQVRGRVAWATGDTVAIRAFDRNDMRFAAPSGVVRRFDDGGDAGRGGR
jgi:hypothetical protein